MSFWSLVRIEAQVMVVNRYQGSFSKIMGIFFMGIVKLAAFYACGDLLKDFVTRP